MSGQKDEYYVIYLYSDVEGDTPKYGPVRASGIEEVMGNLSEGDFQHGGHPIRVLAVIRKDDIEAVSDFIRRC